MPTYEYECRKCGHRFEKFQRISEAPAKRCPKCRGAVRRLLGTGGGLIFKGSGFYITDYRSDSYKKSAKSDAGSSSSSSSSSSTTPAKPAASSGKGT
jgi:putative FmdB family regulatory protein